MVEGVLFDLDGLMFDTEAVWNKVWEQALARFNLEVADGLIDASRGTSKDSMAANIELYYGDAVDPWKVLEAMDDVADVLFLEGCPKMPGLDEILEFLEVQEVPCACASSASEVLVHNHLKNGDVRKYFKAVVTRQNVTHAKPHPEIFLKAAQSLGVTPENTFVLEDSIAGVKAGLAGGFKVIMVPDQLDPTQELLDAGIIVCKNLFEAQEVISAQLA